MVINFYGYKLVVWLSSFLYINSLDINLFGWVDINLSGYTLVWISTCLGIKMSRNHNVMKSGFNVIKL